MLSVCNPKHKRECRAANRGGKVDGHGWGGGVNVESLICWAGIDECKDKKNLTMSLS